MQIARTQKQEREVQKSLPTARTIITRKGAGAVSAMPRPLTVLVRRFGRNRVPMRGAIVAALTVTTLFPTFALAHSWYPHRCCHDLDCFPADMVRRLWQLGAFER